jgi:hypothetical protein
VKAEHQARLNALYKTACEVLGDEEVAMNFLEGEVRAIDQEFKRAEDKSYQELVKEFEGVFGRGDGNE